MTREDELRLHAMVMGRCCHGAARQRVAGSAYRVINVECPDCGAALSWHPASRDEERAALAENPGAVLQCQIGCYGGNGILVQDVVARLRRLGWSCSVAEREGKRVCVVERAGDRFEGLPSEDYSDAVYSAALRLCAAGAIVPAEKAA